MFDPTSDASPTLRRIQIAALAFVLLLAGSRLAYGQTMAHESPAGSAEADKAGIAAILSGAALLVTAAGSQVQGTIRVLREWEEARAARTQPTNREQIAETYRRRIGEAEPDPIERQPDPPPAPYGTDPGSRRHYPTS